MAILEFIKNLSNIKKAQQTLVELELQQRIDLLNKFLNKLEAHRSQIIMDLIQSANVSEAYAGELFNFALEDSRNRLKNAISEALPLGLITIIIDSPITFRSALPILIANLVQGNVVTLLCDSQSILLGAEELPNHLVTHFKYNTELAELIISHPSISMVFYQGKRNGGAELLTIALKFQKRTSFAFEGKASALILDAQNNNYLEIARSCIEGQGTLPWNTSRIFCLEADLDLVSSNMTTACAQYLENVKLSEVKNSKLEDYLKEVKSESGKILFQKDGVVLVKDFNMCSELQQDSLGAPLIFISTVKYLHEMAKWSNTGYLSLTHNIWCGDLDKAKRLARKLEADTVYLNQWSPRAILPFGLKSSSYGLDPRTTSTFCYPIRIES